MTTTFRQNVRSGIYNLLVGWKAVGSNSALVMDVFDHQPPAFNPPLVFVGSIFEAVSHDAGTRIRDVEARVVVVRGTYDNAEQLRLADVVIDSLLDLFSANPHGITADTLLEPIATLDADLEIGGVSYLTTAFRLTGRIQEGR